jgi:hypothetical protein
LFEGVLDFIESEPNDAARGAKAWDAALPNPPTHSGNGDAKVIGHDLSGHQIVLWGSPVHRETLLS